MSQLLLKGVYYDEESAGLWFLNNSGSYEEISVGGDTIYTGDGSLSGDRTIEIGEHDVKFQNGSDDIYLRLKSTTDFELAALIAYDHTGDPLSVGVSSIASENFGESTIGPSISTGGGNVSYLKNTVTQTDISFEIEMSFDDGTKEAGITGNLTSLASSLAYTADTHTFNVGMTITELAGVGTRAIAVDANGKIVLL
jgi:hypothetical protein